MTSTMFFDDAFGRIRDLAVGVVDGLDAGALAWRPDPQANSVGWLVWHLTRVEDDHVAGLAGAEQVWTSAGWADRFELPFDASEIGYGHDPDAVGKVRVPGELLAGYQSAVAAAVLGWLPGIADAGWDRVVDTRWDPPVTAAVRLVSVVEDALQHAGQAAYVRGLAERAA